jgi:tetratricopeptide (TPR) repeat protein
MALREEDYRAARRWLEETLIVDDQLGKEGVSIVNSLEAMGELSLREGDYTQARAYYEQCLSILQKTGGVSWGDKWILANLGYAVLRQGDITHARKYFIESQQRFKEVDSTIGLVYVLEGLASLSTLEERPKRAAKLFAWADATREIIENKRPPIEQTNVDRDLATIHTQLDESAFAAAQAAGRAMSMDQAIVYALEASSD